MCIGSWKGVFDSQIKLEKINVVKSWIAFGAKIRQILISHKYFTRPKILQGSKVKELKEKHAYESFVTAIIPHMLHLCLTCLTYFG